MVNRLPSWIFISLALVLMGVALFPILRFALGIDTQIQIQFLTAVMMLIGGVMCGLTGMILMVRRQPDLLWQANAKQLENESKLSLVGIHASGLLVFTGIPLANFLACYALWLKTRHISELHDKHGREAVCQQISFYLYTMLCLFMALLIIGVFALFFLLFLQFVFCLIACYKARTGILFRYPANIAIIDRRLENNTAADER